jgi:hypothetical protein
MKNMLIGFALIGLLAAACSEAPPTSHAAVTITEAPSPVIEAACLDTIEGARLANSAAQHLTDGVRYLKAFDIDGAADETDRAADDWLALAALYEGLDGGDSQVVTGQLIASLLHDSAEHLRALSIRKATSTISQATPLMDDMTQAVPGFTSQACES